MRVLSSDAEVLSGASAVFCGCRLYVASLASCHVPHSSLTCVFCGLEMLECAVTASDQMPLRNGGENGRNG